MRTHRWRQRAVCIAALTLTMASTVWRPGLAWGQDLADIWQLALQYDPDYASIQAGSQAEQEKVPQARAQLLPYVVARAGADLNDTRRRRNLSDSHTQHRAFWALTLSQPIFDISAWGTLQRAQYIAAAANVDQAQGHQNLILRVAQAYFDVLTAQDTLRALQAQKQATEHQLRAAQQGFELGSRTITDTHETRARLDLVLASEFDAVNTLQVSKDILMRIIHQAPETLAELPADTVLPAPEPNRLDVWIAQAMRANLAVARADLEARIVEKQVDIAKSEHYPTLQLLAQTGSATDRGIRGQYPDPGPRSVDSSVGVVLSIPLFTGGELSSVVREQSSRLQQRRHDVEAAKRAAQQNTKQYFSGVTSGLARINALEAAEQSSLSALQANQLAYEIGVRINIDVLNAQQQLYETQRQLSRVRYDTLMDSLRLKASSGTLNEQDLLAVNALLAPPAATPQP